MFIKYLLLFLLLFMGLAHCANFPALRSVFGYFGMGKKSISEMSLEELGISKGNCFNDFLTNITYAERYRCELDDKNILHLMDEPRPEEVRKPPIMVKCLQPEYSANVTAIDNSLQVMESFKGILNLLKPVGNATKRHEPGSCVLVFFYTDTSIACTQVSKYVHALPALFPTLRMAAIDAMKFHSFNTDFGIIGLPTLLLFHQGRPIVKFHSDMKSFASFISRHTGIRPKEITQHQLANIVGPLPLEPESRTDYVLVLAWIFLLTVFVHFFLNSAFCKQFIDFIKRNWRESEAQLEH